MNDVELHPFASVPVTAYEVELVGDTVTVALVDPSGLHEYDTAPDAERVADWPRQILWSGVTTMTGNGRTVTAALAEAVHPVMSVTVTV